MRQPNPIAYIAVIYLIVTALGLYTGQKLVEKIKTEELPPAVSNPDSIASSLEIVVYILLMTCVMLLLIRYKLDSLIKFLSFLAVFGGIAITLYCLNETYGIFIAIIVIALAHWRSQNIIVLNTALILTVTGVGSFLGASLSLVPAALLLIALSIYDLISVFWTKHMVTLAEKAKGKLPFMFLIPSGGRNIGLGTGDIAIPLVFTVAILKDYSIFNAFSASLGGLAGIIALFLYIQRKKNIVLPALPPITLGAFAGFLLSLLPSIF
jgi:presenilin-like A22 family membrane protease